MPNDAAAGYLDLLLLSTVRSRPGHGYEIAHELRRKSRGAFDLNDGTIYPALHRLEDEGFIEAEWGVSELGRKARFYKLTPKGRKQLAAETRRFAEFVQAVSPILLPG